MTYVIKSSHFIRTWLNLTLRKIIQQVSLLHCRVYPGRGENFTLADSHFCFCSDLVALLSRADSEGEKKKEEDGLVLSFSSTHWGPGAFVKECRSNTVSSIWSRSKGVSLMTSFDFRESKSVQEVLFALKY